MKVSAIISHQRSSFLCPTPNLFHKLERRKQKLDKREKVEQMTKQKMSKHLIRKKEEKSYNKYCVEDQQQETRVRRTRTVY